MNLQKAAKDYYIDYIENRPVKEQTFIDCFIAGGKQALKQQELSKLSYVSADENVSADLSNYTVTYKGTTKRLPKKVLQLIHYFIANKGKVITRDALIKCLWEDNVVIGERTIDVHVKKIRNALFNDCVESVKGVGYKWK